MRRISPSPDPSGVQGLAGVAVHGMALVLHGQMDPAAREGPGHSDDRPTGDTASSQVMNRSVPVVLAATGPGGSVIAWSAAFPAVCAWSAVDGPRLVPESAASPWPRTSRIDWTVTRYLLPIGTMRIPICSHSPARAIWYAFHLDTLRIDPRVGTSVVGPKARIVSGVHWLLIRRSPCRLLVFAIEARALFSAALSGAGARRRPAPRHAVPSIRLAGPAPHPWGTAWF